MLQFTSEERKQRVLLPAGSRHRQQASWLLDDQQIPVLVDDAQFQSVNQRLLFHAARLGAMSFHSVPGLEAAADVLRHLPVYQNQPIPNVLFRDLRGAAKQVGNDLNDLSGRKGHPRVDGALELGSGQGRTFPLESTSEAGGEGWRIISRRAIGQKLGDLPEQTGLVFSDEAGSNRCKRSRNAVGSPSVTA